MKNIALIGNPNCGKTTIFNNLTGSRQKVGNWPGVTVEKKTGEYHHQGAAITVTDLPGIYSLTPAPQNNSIDQQITNNFIKNNPIDLYINILDATNLKRNFYLTLQLINLGLPCLIVINMMDKARLQKLNINIDTLSTLLNCPVITISSTQDTKKNTEKLKNLINASNVAYKSAHSNYDPENIYTNLNINPLPCPNIAYIASHFIKLNTIVKDLAPVISTISTTNFNIYGYIIQLLETEWSPEHDTIEPHISDAIAQAKQQIITEYDEDPDIIIADLRYQLINVIYSAITNFPIVKESVNKAHTRKFHLDNIILNKYLGIPIFLFILYSIFELSISLGEVFKPFFELPSGFIAEYTVTTLGNALNLSSNLTLNLSQGFATGIVTVAGFIPQILFMFILLTYLEDSGYMARAAFVMDRLMQFAGLPGKSFVPLIISFGCNVPAILSTRTLNSPRDRILTCLMSPFMSCSARLAIFIVFASAFFPAHQGLMVFLLYLTGIIIAILTGLLLKNTILTDKPMPFILELPSYNLPTVKNIFIATTQRCKGFIVRAGKLIIPICISLQFLNSLQLNGEWLNKDTNNLEQSVLSQTGKFITPVLNPIGVTNDNWPATVGLITGSLAKEVVVGTLNTLYSHNSEDIDDNTENKENGFVTQLIEKINTAKELSYGLLMNLFSSNHYNIANKTVDESDFSSQSFAQLHAAFPSTAAAFAYCLFVLLYMPCLSTFSILMKEIGKNWAIASLIWSLDIAYFTAAITYQISMINATPVQSTCIISILLISHLFIYKLLRSGKLNRYFNNHIPTKTNDYITAT